MSAPENPQLDQRDRGPELSQPTPAEAPEQMALASALPGPPGSPPPPVENPPWNGWDVLLIAALVFVVMAVLQLAVTKAAQWFWFPHSTFYEAAQKVTEKPILVIASQILFYIPIAVFMIALVEGKYRVPFWRSICWSWPASIWKFIAAGGAMLLVLTLFENLFPMPKDTPFEHLFDKPIDAYLMALIAVTFAPLMEELFFRGFLYPVLARWLGVPSGIVLSALPFALVHLPQYGYAWAAGLTILVVGVVCGIVRASTKSVGACFLVHAAYNGTQMLIAVILTRGFTHMPKGLLECFSG